MSDHVTSPDLSVDDGIVKTRKEFSDSLTQELTDDEIATAFKVMLPIVSKWHERWVLKFSNPFFTAEEALEEIDKFEEELKYELATKLHVYATVDATPIFEGEPPIVELAGALPSHSVARHGFDHEKKIFEVKRATERGED